MELQEVIEEIKSRLKPWAQVGMSQSTYSNTIRNIQAGLAKQSTVDAFMSKFGYKVKSERKWHKL